MNSRILAVALALVSIWVVIAAGITAIWLTQEVRVVGLVMVPAAIVAALLVLYFDWREKLRQRIAGERDKPADLERAA